MSYIETPGDSSCYDSLVKDLQRRFGTKEGLFLANRVAKGIRQCGDFCMSHSRFARKSCLSEVSTYETIRAGGCCGEWDDECTFIDKETGKITVFMFGWNHGH